MAVEGGSEQVPDSRNISGREYLLPHLVHLIGLDVFI